MSYACSSHPPGNTVKNCVTFKLRAYLELSKSGIVVLVLLTGLAGALAGTSLEHGVHLRTLLIGLVGLALIASGSLAFNQIQEVELDRKMNRTRKRPLQTGALSMREASVFVGLTVGVGTTLLIIAEPRAAFLGLLTIALYNGLYTLWWKPRMVFGAVPGALPGALPVLIGFSLGAHQIVHPGGVYLFLLMFFWQMPHFWSLAIRYAEDYALGGVPTLPTVSGKEITVDQITVWCIGYLGIALIAPLFLPLGAPYLCAAALMGLKIGYELWRYRQQGEKRWLRFFLWVNGSLIYFLFAVVLELWRPYFESFFI